MEKVTKSYVEKIYNGLLFCDSVIEEVEERNPLLIKNDGHILGFRFFDKGFIVDEGIEYESKTFNYSSWIYFGERYSFDELFEKHNSDRSYKILLDNMRYNNYMYACETQMGTFLNMEDGDMTFDEYLSKKNEKCKIKNKTN